MPLIQPSPAIGRGFFINVKNDKINDIHINNKRKKMNKENTKKSVVKAARILDDKKADNIKIYDLKGLSSLCDYILIATATSAPHLDALEQEASTELKKDGVYKSNRDGGESGNWRVSDYGGFMLHLMTAQTREFYALDKVFSFGKLVNWAANPNPTQIGDGVKVAPAKKKMAKKAVKKIKAAPKKKAVAKKKLVKKTIKKPAKKTAKKAKK